MFMIALLMFYEKAGNKAMALESCIKALKLDP